MAESSTFTRLKEEIGEDDVVLDIGTKDGRQLEGVKGTKIGFDITSKQFDRETSVNFLLADARQLPFRTNSIDYVFCHQVLEHLPRHGELLAEASRVLKPEGKAYFSFPNRLSLRQPHSLIPRYYSLLPRRLGLWLAPHILDQTSQEYYERAIFPLSPISARRHLHANFDGVSYPMRLDPEAVTSVQFLQRFIWWCNMVAMYPPLRWFGELFWPATTYLCSEPSEDT